MVKRYRLDTECIIDMEEGKVLSMVQIRNKLNKLNDENEQLKQDGGYWAETAEARRKEIDKLKEENEQLKQSISDWKGSYDELYEDVTRLEKENEELKQIIYEDESQIIGEWSSHIQKRYEKIK